MSDTAFLTGGCKGSRGSSARTPNRSLGFGGPTFLQGTSNTAGSSSAGLESITDFRKISRAPMSFERGPAEGRIVRRPGLAIGACFPYGVLPVVGRNPYRPQHREGMRIDPMPVNVLLPLPGRRMTYQQHQSLPQGASPETRSEHLRHRWILLQ